MKNETGLNNQRYKMEFFHSQNDAYAILQLKDDETTEKELYTPMSGLVRMGERPREYNYNVVYSGKLEAKLKNKREIMIQLEKYYEIFNIDHPADFRGRSLSVSDIVALKIGKDILYYYVDPIGFVLLEDFQMDVD